MDARDNYILSKLYKSSHASRGWYIYFLLYYYLGYYIGGDHVKWGFPMAFATTIVAMSGIHYGDVYAEMGAKGDLYKQVKHIGNF